MVPKIKFNLGVGLLTVFNFPVLLKTFTTESWISVCVRNYLQKKNYNKICRVGCVNKLFTSMLAILDLNERVIFYTLSDGTFGNGE